MQKVLKWTHLFSRIHKENNDFNMNNKKEAPKKGLFKQIWKQEGDNPSGPEKGHFRQRYDHLQGYNEVS